MGILVTRPEESGQALTAMLNQEGIAAIHLPLCKITKGAQLDQFPKKLQQLNPFDKVICVSQYAVYYAQQVLQNTGFTWRSDLAYMAVGRKTAMLLSEATQQPVSYPFLHESSEGLLNLPLLKNCQDYQILILRGQSGRELLSEQLAKRGAKIEQLACYHRDWQKLDNGELTIFSRAGIDTIIVTSGEILWYLLDFIPKSEHNWLLNCKLLVVSKRIAQLAMQSGWQEDKIILTEKADNLSLLKTILSFYPHLRDKY
ncbi:uroporphyrinogen-III synthase [Gallibacterium trehalosifermentans]|uniref:Uroporphyrinogen-III synthase n=1 Tax=Gallibacterium trehalosifermentans TaxID=516935 RepID=A0ABV6GYA6_9PAST